MKDQEKLDKAFRLRNEANKLEKTVADKYLNEIINLSKNGKEDEARDKLKELEWHESIHKFNLIRLIRVHSKQNIK